MTPWNTVRITVVLYCQITQTPSKRRESLHTANQLEAKLYLYFAAFALRSYCNLHICFHNFHVNKGFVSTWYSEPSDDKVYYKYNFVIYLQKLVVNNYWYVCLIFWQFDWRFIDIYLISSWQNYFILNVDTFELAISNEFTMRASIWQWGVAYIYVKNLICISWCQA